MQGGGVHAAQIVFLLLLLLVAAFGALARKLKTPFPIVLVIAGLAISFIPGLPRISLNPDLVFFVFLPPLLYAAAWATSWRDFRFNLVSIVLLAVGLVAFTVFSVAAVAPRIFPGFDWRLGFLLGAVVAPTDAIAATSIARRVGLPRRIVDILEGESLVNDATGLLALQFGVSMLMSGQAPSVPLAVARLVYLVVAGIGIGLLLAVAVEWFEHQIDDAAVEITLSLLVPYGAYLAAEAVRASGVLAVVACGLYLARRSAGFFSPTVRIQAWAVWNSLSFILNGVVFVLIGLQLPQVLAGIRGIPIQQLLLDAALFSALVIAVRLAWVFPGAWLAWFIRTRFLHQMEPPPGARQVFVVGWTGMRGVISLAAAIGIPMTVGDGSPFPQRDLIVFLTFSAILTTLVLQGLTLPRVVHALGLAGLAGGNCEEQEARRIVTRAALDYLADARQKDRPEFADLYDDVEQHYREQLAGDGGTEDGTDAVQRRSRELSRETIRVERDTAVGLRNEGRINDEVLRSLERELDLRETRLDGGRGA
jgi:CPA1 family monovalent cation:H+ antiporter